MHPFFSLSSASRNLKDPQISQIQQENITNQGVFPAIFKIISLPADKKPATTR